MREQQIAQEESTPTKEVDMICREEREERKKMYRTHFYQEKVARLQEQSDLVA